MVLRSIYFDVDLWTEAMAKAKRTRVPLAIIIRKLVASWLKGEISIKINDE